MSSEETAKAPKEAVEIPEEVSNFLEVIPPSVRGWLLGETQQEPPELSAAMDQVAERINMATAYVVVQRMAQMGQMLSFLQELECGLFDPERIKKMDAKERMTYYRTLTKESNEFLEFVRKFTLQNKEMFSRTSQADELAGILRELDPSVVQELLRVFSKKGAGTTVHDLTPQRPKTDKAKKNSVLSELIDE